MVKQIEYIALREFWIRLFEEIRISKKYWADSSKGEIDASAEFLKIETVYEIVESYESLSVVEALELTDILLKFNEKQFM